LEKHDKIEEDKGSKDEEESPGDTPREINFTSYKEPATAAARRAIRAQSVLTKINPREIGFLARHKCVDKMRPVSGLSTASS
jgi:hypothetical protein